MAATAGHVARKMIPFVDRSVMPDTAVPFVHVVSFESQLV